MVSLLGNAITLIKRHRVPRINEQFRAVLISSSDHHGAPRLDNRLIGVRLGALMNLVLQAIWLGRRRKPRPNCRVIHVKVGHWRLSHASGQVAATKGHSVFEPLKRDAYLARPIAFYGELPMTIATWPSRGAQQLQDIPDDPRKIDSGRDRVS